MPRNNQSAEDLPLPPGWKPPGTPHGYYGSASHNLKAIYQRYMGRLDGYPASLWQYPPQAAATGYVEVIGGQQAVLDKSRPTPTAGDLRFAAELLNHAVFADPGDTAARGTPVNGPTASGGAPVFPANAASYSKRAKISRWRARSAGLLRTNRRNRGVGSADGGLVPAPLTLGPGWLCPWLPGGPAFRGRRAGRRRRGRWRRGRWR